MVDDYGLLQAAEHVMAVGSTDWDRAPPFRTRTSLEIANITRPSVCCSVDADTELTVLYGNARCWMAPINFTRAVIYTCEPGIEIVLRVRYGSGGWRTQTIREPAHVNVSFASYLPAIVRAHIARTIATINNSVVARYRRENYESKWVGYGPNGPLMGEEQVTGLLLWCDDIIRSNNTRSRSRSRSPVRDLYRKRRAPSPSPSPPPVRDPRDSRPPTRVLAERSLSAFHGPPPPLPPPPTLPLPPPPPPPAPTPTPVHVPEPEPEPVNDPIPEPPREPEPVPMLEPEPHEDQLLMAAARAMIAFRLAIAV
jgi:hypothetical protein